MRPQANDASVREFVASLPADGRAALEFLAIADPMPSADLSALAGEDAVRAAQAADAITVETTTPRRAGGHTRCTPTRRGRRCRTTICTPRRTALYERLSGQRPRDVVDRLRLAVLALDSDNPQPVSDVVAAAADALRLGDLPLSERLGEAVLARDPDLDARLTLAQALAWQGRGREADEVLAAVDPDGLSDTELMAWALPRAANQFWMLSEPERATAFLQTTRNRVTSPVARTTVDALSATFAMNAGRPGRAMEIAERGAGVAGRRRHRGRLVGRRRGAELCADGPIRRRRRARRTGDGGAASGAAPIHQRVRPDDGAGDGGRAGPGAGARPAADRFRADATAGAGDR